MKWWGCAGVCSTCNCTGGLLAELNTSVSRLHPGEDEGPRFSSAFDFVYLALRISAGYANRKGEHSMPNAPHAYQRSGAPGVGRHSGVCNILLCLVPTRDHG